MRRGIRYWLAWPWRQSVWLRMFWLLTCAVAFVFILDRVFPLPVPGGKTGGSVLVVARDGTPMRVFPDGDHVWRDAITPDQVSPRYIQALLHYEDRTFWWHPGVNPLALARAVWQRLRYGHVVSGASTLTMQVARIIDPKPHTLLGKLHQMLRALQLEMHYSKRQILTIYLNYAPMGGIIEGVEAASRAYLGHSSRRLSAADAAMLTVLPQAPSLLRPDRFPEHVRAARDKVLRRMVGVWDRQTIVDALRDPIVALPLREPMLAPLLAERLKRSHPGWTRIDTAIDPDTQDNLASLLLQRVSSFPKSMSIAAMVMDNDTLGVIAYAGSADYANMQRSGYIDMVHARRSPGSTLKPFLYGLALDDGLIDSESLMVDAPQSFHGYDPSNFEDGFHGAVSVSEALVQSLNVPAVDMLDRLGATYFVSHLQSGGVEFVMPPGAKPNLSVILGGGATTLAQLVGAYRALAHRGIAGKPRYADDEPRIERRMMSAGAAFIVRDILASGGGQAGFERGEIPGVAWKTGTSYGFRDAWAIGVNDHYTVGVWVGRPDGTANPGFFGASVAEPLLMQIFAGLPRGRMQHQPPASVGRANICWPLGRREGVDDASLCLMRRSAWLLNGLAPPTLPDRTGADAVQTVLVDRASGLRVTDECSHGPTELRRIARWPNLLEPWLDRANLNTGRSPAWAAGCHARETEALHIVGAIDGERLRSGNGDAALTLVLSARGAETTVHWMLDDRQFAVSSRDNKATLTLAEPGEHDITAEDESGRYDHVRVYVQR